MAVKSTNLRKMIVLTEAEFERVKQHQERGQFPSESTALRDLVIFGLAAHDTDKDILRLCKQMHDQGDSLAKIGGIIDSHPRVDGVIVGEDNMRAILNRPQEDEADFVVFMNGQWCTSTLVDLEGEISRSVKERRKDSKTG